MKPIEEFQGNLMKMEGELKSVLPANIDSKRFINVTLTALQQKPELLNLNRQSLFNACRQCASDGLIPDGREAAFVPFKDEVKYMPMVGGLVKKLNEAGVSVNPQVVHKNDKFRYWVDETGPHIVHEPDVFGDRGEAIGVYNIAKTSEGITHIEAMSKDDVEKVRKQSKVPNSLMWINFWGEGAKKTVIRRSYKWLPKNPKLEEFIKHDDEDNFDYSQPSEPATATEDKTSPRLSKVIEAQGKAVESEPSVTEPEPAKQPYAEFIEGVITDLKIDKTRYGCVINGVIYGTIDEDLYKKMCEAADSKKPVRITYYRRPGLNNKTINEAVQMMILGETNGSPIG